jgi:putative membrane protein
MFEIQASQLALTKDPDADTKPFAQRMVQDHQSTSQELKALVDSSKVIVTLPTALDDTHQKMLDDLRAKNGKDFDQAYDHAQQQTHQEAVELFQNYADRGDNTDLKEWAAKTLPHLKEHLAMAQKLN